MIKFETDFAAFGAIAGYIKDDTLLSESRISYLNKAFINSYGNHEGTNVFGAGIVKDMQGFDMAYNIALEHHEHYDGTGYPHGKKGNEISLEWKQ